jgi:hypothetical protein
MPGHPSGCGTDPGVLTLAAARRILTDHPSIDGTLCPLAVHALTSIAAAR